MLRSFAHRSIAIVGIFFVPSISYAQCWIAGVRNTESTVAVTFMNLRVQGLQGIAQRKGTDPTSEVLFRFTVAEGKVLRDGELSPELLVPSYARIQIIGGAHANCTLESTIRGGVQGVLVSAVESGGPGAPRVVEVFKPAQ